MVHDPRLGLRLRHVVMPTPVDDEHTDVFVTSQVALPEGRAGPPFDQSYGQREVHVSEPDNCLPPFGSEPQRRTDAA